MDDVSGLRTMELWGTSEDALRKDLPAWKEFLLDADDRGHLVMMSPEAYCPYLEGSEACYVVNQRGAQILGLDDGEDVTSPTLMLSGDREQETPALVDRFAEELSFARELDADSGIPTQGLGSPVVANAGRDYWTEQIQVRTLQGDGKFPIYSAGGAGLSSDDGSTVTTRAVVVLPSHLVAATNVLSMITTGGAFFRYATDEEMQADLEKYGVTDTVAWIERPEETVATELARARMYTVQLGAIAAINLFAALTVSVLFGLAYYEQNRRQIFIKRAFGARWFGLYGLFALNVALIGLAGLVITPDAFGATLVYRTATVALILLVGFAVPVSKVRRSHTTDGKIA